MARQKDKSIITRIETVNDVGGDIYIEIKSNHYRYKMSTTKVKKSELNPDLEKVLENVESGKETLTKYKNFDEYIKHTKF